MATQPLDRRRPHSPPARGSAKSKDGSGGPPSAALTGLITHPWLVLVGLITASIMEVLDTTIINVALPQMAGNLSATTDEIAWVVTGYILSNVVVLPMTAWLAQRFGRKRYLVVSIGIFIASSFLCGVSHGLWELVFWRIIQGAGGAALLSTAQATLRQIFPPEKQGHRAGHLYPGNCGGPHPRPDARRLHHGQLQLALGVLYQRSHWPRVHVSGVGVSA